jgi:cysteinyl-tRNA synthetase
LETTQFGGRRWAGEVLRLAMLKTHYREPINWSVQRLEEAERELLGWIENFRFSIPHESNMSLHVNKRPELDVSALAALSDDLNTADAVTQLHRLSGAARKGDGRAASKLAESLMALGLYRPEFDSAYDRSSWGARGGPTTDGRAPPIHLVNKYRSAVYEARTVVLNKYAWKQVDGRRREASRRAVEEEINSLFPDLADDGVALTLGEHCDVNLVSLTERAAEAHEFIKTVGSLIAARLTARKAKNWALSDRIRDELAAMGIQLKDGKDPQTGEPITTWEAKR